MDNTTANMLNLSDMYTTVYLSKKNEGECLMKTEMYITNQKFGVPSVYFQIHFALCLG